MSSLPFGCPDPMIRLREHAFNLFFLLPGNEFQTSDQRIRLRARLFCRFRISNPTFKDSGLGPHAHIELVTVFLSLTVLFFGHQSAPWSAFWVILGENDPLSRSDLFKTVHDPKEPWEQQKLRDQQSLEKPNKFDDFCLSIWFGQIFGKVIDQMFGKVFDKVSGHVSE